MGTNNKDISLTSIYWSRKFLKHGFIFSSASS